MSDAHTPQAPIDPNELRRCIAVCFSPNDFRSFAENLGVTNLGSWDHGIQDGAREVVRHFERLGTLDQLVAKLAEAKPLMEWPGAVPSAETTATVVETNTPPTTSSDTPQLDTAPPAAATVDTAATAPLAPVPPVKPFGLTIPAPEPVLRDPFAPAWPGTATPAATTNPKGAEGQKSTPIIAAVAVLVAFVAIAIFFVVRVSRTPERQAMEIIAGRPLRPNGPARMAADAMKRSLESLARGCDLEWPRGTDVDVGLFSAAYTQCGTRPGIAFPPPGLRVDKPRSLDTPGDPADSPNDAPTRDTPRQTNPGRDNAARPVPAPAPAKPVNSDGCIEKCAATKRQCNRACGSEPTSGSQFDRWQGCQTSCLSTASKCQLACQ